MKPVTIQKCLSMYKKGKITVIHNGKVYFKKEG
jgi:hypothetical protein